MSLLGLEAETCRVFTNYSRLSLCSWDQAWSEHSVSQLVSSCVPRKTCLAFLSDIALSPSGAEGYCAVPMRHLHDTVGVS